ncbi:MAG: TIM barrel protein [Saprospiraceae bacterium]|nr:TIM barrel protein [Saprospiraceae bacterium]
MAKIKIGCETYTWQMPGEQYKGRLEHIMQVCQQAGFAGIEPESSFLRHLSDPILLQEALDKYQMELAVLCVVEDWLDPKETPEERKRADGWINFLSHFPDTLLLLVQMPQANRDNLAVRQANCISCVNDFARRAAEKGIICSKHPNSPLGSVFRTESDYAMMMEGLDSEVIGYCPDVGHIAKGNMDPMAIIKEYRDAVNLVHYKDMHDDGRWAATGEGIIEFEAIAQYLIDTDYRGWIIIEDECDACITDPDGITLKDGLYIDRVLKPMFKE